MGFKVPESDRRTLLEADEVTNYAGLVSVVVFFAFWSLALCGAGRG